MYQLKREQALPTFLKRRITIRQLAKEAGVSEKAAERAINGLPIQAALVDRICAALNIEPMEILVERRC